MSSPRRNKKKLIRPDLSITHDANERAASNERSGIATLEPVTVPLVILEEPRETYIELLHRPERNLVAVLELLSPSNKTEPGRSVYLARRNSLLHQSVHLVELDLLLGGLRPPFAKPLRHGDYFAMVSRGDHRPNCAVYAWSLRQPLPPIPIPLKAPDPDIWLNLDAVFATARSRWMRKRSVGCRNIGKLQAGPFSSNAPPRRLCRTERIAFPRLARRTFCPMPSPLL